MHNGSSESFTIDVQSSLPAARFDGSFYGQRLLIVLSPDPHVYNVIIFVRQTATGKSDQDDFSSQRR